MLRGTAYVFGFALTGWLAAAAAAVDIEYYDGLSAICNARYFLGWSDAYVFDRGPLMGWVQLPAEWIKRWLGLHPLDVRAHHATMALVHCGYLLATYRALTRYFGRDWAVLIAYASAITSYIFASYAPFVSHDLAPGALLLWMLIWSDEFVTSFRTGDIHAVSPRWRLWVSLVAVGTLAPLIKQTFGVFWIAVLAAQLFSLMQRKHADRTAVSALVWLAAGAALSALLAWGVYGIVLANWAPTLPWWLRPYRNLQYLAGVYDGTDVTFPLWIYARNYWAYGRVTALLVIPGLWLALRGSDLQRRIAIAWIIAVVFVHAMPLREVRYLAFAAPLSAFLIVPALRLVARWNAAAAAIMLLLALDVGGTVLEAARIGEPFYRQSELKALVDPLPEVPTPRRPLFLNTWMLSFVAPEQSPLAADRYHRVFHVGEHHLRVLYGYSRSSIRMVPPNVALTARAPEGSMLLFANWILAHGPTWRPRPPIGSDTFAQGLATLETRVLQRQPEGAYRAADSPRPAANAQGYVMPVWIADDESVFPLTQRADGSFEVPLPAGGVPPETLTMRAFVVRRMSRPAR